MVNFLGTVVSDYVKNVNISEQNKVIPLDFAATDFSTLRLNLINYIKAVYPEDYNYFAESDLGMMLLELVAAMGHIISYKVDYLANENYLATARSRRSVKKLLELVGIRMKGPIAAAANAEIAIESLPANYGYLTIAGTSRIVTISSPLDGLPITYTLYKIKPNGFLELSQNSENVVIFPSENEDELLLKNLVLLEGSFVQETGTFADTEALKNITLTQKPVIEGSIECYIQSSDPSKSGNYKQVENLFFASGPSDKIFQVVSDDNFGATIVLGDNNFGISPSYGDQYTITYRIGGGVRGNLAREVINVPIALTTSSNGAVNGTLENSSQATGGSDAETIEQAKRYGPATFRRQDRVVTLEDYKTFANSFISKYGSVGKATAVTRKAYSSANIVDLYVLEKANDLQLRKATPEFKRQLLEAINDKKMLTEEVVVVDGLIRTLDLAITLRCDKKYEVQEDVIKQKVSERILQYFSFSKTEFGKSFSTQEFNNFLFQIPEIRYSTIDNIPPLINAVFNEIIQLNNFTITMVFE